MRENKTNCGIYKITNKLDNKIYIGSAQNLKNREYSHFKNLKDNNHKNNHLQNAFNRDGHSSFKFLPLRYIQKIENKTSLKEELLKWEQYYLNEFIINGNIDHNRCYNINSIAWSCLGTKRSNEVKKNKSLEMQKLWLDKNYKDHMVKIHTGKKQTSSHIQKKVKSREGYVHSEETINKIRESKLKPVLNTTTGESFKSAKEASKYYNINYTNLVAVCNKRRKTVGGFIFKYI